MKVFLLLDNDNVTKVVTTNRTMLVEYIKRQGYKKDRKSKNLFEKKLAPLDGFEGIVWCRIQEMTVIPKKMRIKEGLNLIE